MSRFLSLKWDKVVFWFNRRRRKNCFRWCITSFTLVCCYVTFSQNHQQPNVHSDFLVLLWSNTLHPSTLFNLPAVDFFFLNPLFFYIGWKQFTKDVSNINTWRETRNKCVPSFVILAVVLTFFSVDIDVIAITEHYKL